MRTYKYNWGKLIFFRWIIVSWIFQAIHVLDATERLFRVLFEVVTVGALIFLLVSTGPVSFFSVITSFVIIHSLFWIFDSTWLVGYRDVNKSYKGKGIQSVIEYLEYVEKDLSNSQSTSAILVFGSLCRKNMGLSSDLDLRIVRDTKINPFSLFLKGIKYRIYALKYHIPLDLKIVDSYQFLKEEMREDEHPIVVKCVNPKSDYIYGDTLQMLKDNSDNYTRKE